MSDINNLLENAVEETKNVIGSRNLELSDQDSAVG